MLTEVSGDSVIFVYEDNIEVAALGCSEQLLIFRAVCSFTADSFVLVFSDNVNIVMCCVFTARSELGVD